jgi:hypothetical protein
MGGFLILACPIVCVLSFLLLYVRMFGVGPGNKKSSGPAVSCLDYMHLRSSHYGVLYTPNGY